MRVPVVIKHAYDASTMLLAMSLKQTMQMQHEQQAVEWDAFGKKEAWLAVGVLLQSSMTIQTMKNHLLVSKGSKSGLRSWYK